METTKEKNRLRCKLYYANNKEKLQEKRKGYSSKYYQDNKKLVNSKAIEKRLADPGLNNLHKLRSALWKYVTGKSKKGIYLETFGVKTWQELRNHFEKQFTPEMNWLNYGGKYGWQIDHKIPCSKFDLTNQEQIKICFNINNLRPVWAHDNRINYYKYNEIRVKEYNTYKPILFEIQVFCPFCRKKQTIKVDDKFFVKDVNYINCNDCKKLFGLKYRACGNQSVIK
jgi:hypothetical protein